MTPDEIREIVRITLEELNRGKDDYPYILKDVEKKLQAFFNDENGGDGISMALKKMLDDPYIDVIFLQYRDGKKIDWIAEALDVEVRTILRNKKRIILKLHELMEV